MTIERLMTAGDLITILEEENKDTPVFIYNLCNGKASEINHVFYDVDKKENLLKINLGFVEEK